jgi:hypothetical protein
MKTLFFTTFLFLMTFKIQAQTINCASLTNIDVIPNSNEIKNIYSSQLIVTSENATKNSLISETGIKLQNGFRGLSNGTESCLIKIRTCETINQSTTPIAATREQEKVEEVTKATLTLFPNPTVERLTLKWTNHEFVKINIINNEGKTIISNAIENTKTTTEITFDVSFLSAGIYTAILEGTSTEAVRFIKNN